MYKSHKDIDSLKHICTKAPLSKQSRYGMKHLPTFLYIPNSGSRTKSFGTGNEDNHFQKCSEYCVLVKQNIYLYNLQIYLFTLIFLNSLDGVSCYKKQISLFIAHYDNMHKMGQSRIYSTPWHCLFIFHSSSQN